MSSTCTSQEGFPIQGTLHASIFHSDSISNQAEQEPITYGTLIYHYFEGDEYLANEGLPLWRVIEASQGKVGSRIKCYSREEILHSLTTNNPHYGDGAYFTLHACLNEAHIMVKQTHGMSIANRFYRAVFKVVQPDTLRKFRLTGGVGRTISVETSLRKGDLIYLGGLEDVRVQYLWIENLTSLGWKRFKGGD